MEKEKLNGWYRRGNEIRLYEDGVFKWNVFRTIIENQTDFRAHGLDNSGKILFGMRDDARKDWYEMRKTSIRLPLEEDERWTDYSHLYALPIDRFIDYSGDESDIESDDD